MKQYPVDIHCHTVASTHAYSTVHDYFAVAKQKQMALFAITDHGPEMADAPHFWHFVNMRVLPRVYQGIGLLRGIEANIKNTAGEIDFFGDYLTQLDIVLAGFHEPVWQPSTCEQHTQAMVNAIKSGHVDVISHPGNPSYPIDIETVVKAAAEYEVALEVNNSSFICSRTGSKDNCIELVKLAKQYDAPIVMGSDSHVAFTLGGFEQSLAIIEQAQYPVEKLINRSPQALLAFLAERGHQAIPEFDGLWD